MVFAGPASAVRRGAARRVAKGTGPHVLFYNEIHFGQNGMAPEQDASTGLASFFEKLWWAHGDLWRRCHAFMKRRRLR